MASYLAQGYSLEDAIKLAKNYVTRAIQTSDKLKIGNGAGPVNHFYMLEKYNEMSDEHE